MAMLAEPVHRPAEPRAAEPAGRAATNGRTAVLARTGVLLNARPALVAQRALARPLSAASPVQRMAVIQRVIDLAGALQVKPGPPPTYSSGGWYYKVFGQKNQADAMENEWSTASTNGIPVPRFEVKQVSVAAGGGGGAVTRWAFRSKAAQGDTFFQFSKPGHTGRVTGWIDTQTDKRELGRLKSMFDYAQAHLGDAQGFFSTSSTRIEFIDINTGGTTPNAGTAATACQTRIDQLP